MVENSQVKESSVAFVSIASKNHLHFADVLMQGCKQFYPDSMRFVLLLDDPLEKCDSIKDRFEIVRPSQLKLDNWTKLCFQYTAFELSCALKPSIMRFACERGSNIVLYLDSDMEICSPIPELMDALTRQSILLTSHLIGPCPEDGQWPPQAKYLEYGIYNGGLISVRSDLTGRSFLEWWESRLKQQCHVDLAGGFFVDQKWLDFVPGVFENVGILRHLGYNAGHWTFAQCQRFHEPTESGKSRQSRLWVDDFPVRIFHYSGMTPKDPIAYLKYQTRSHLDAHPALKKLVSNYHVKLSDASTPSLLNSKYGFDFLSDGTWIDPKWRELVRSGCVEFDSNYDPFSEEAQTPFIRLLKQKSTAPIESRVDWRLKQPKRQTTYRKMVKSIEAALRRYRYR